MTKGGATDPADAPLRILAWPRSRNRADNPYTSLLYDALHDRGAHSAEFDVRAALTGDYDVLHVHWPEGVLTGSRARQLLAAGAMAAVLLTVRFVRRRAVAWTVHNAQPHRQTWAPARRIIDRALRLSTSGLLFLSHASHESYVKTREWARRKPTCVTPHGRYGAHAGDLTSDRDTRAALGVGPAETLIAFIGRLEQYKRPDRLLHAFESLSLPGARLLLAGRPSSDDYGRRLVAAAAASSAIAEFDWLSDRRMAELLGAADIVVYPYDEILNSGSIILPLEYGTRVIAPRKGSIPEVAEMVGDGWITTYRGDLSEDVLRRVVETPVPSEGPDLRGLEWSPIAADTEVFLRSLVRRRLR